MTKNFFGNCNWCNKKEEVSSTPIAGIRLCNNCFMKIGKIFMTVVADLKHLEQFKDEEKTSSSVIKIIRFLYKLVEENIKKNIH